MKRIVTHSGSFHTDEIFAVAALKLYLKDEPVEIVRSRDPEVIATGDYVLDVGGEDDPAADRFDHHQTGGAGQRDNGIPYACFGLIWKEYGEQVCDGDAEVAQMVDAKLVQPIDAPDNGVSLTGPSEYDGVYPYFIQSAVNIFKPTWRESSADIDATFDRLVSVATTLLQREIRVAADKIAGGRLVEEAYQASEDKQVIRLDKDLPWEHTLSQKPEPEFVVYPKDNGRWRLEAVPEENFDRRRELPKHWRGKRSEKLQAATGVESALFCHGSLPMIVAGEKEGIEKLTQMALDN